MAEEVHALVFAFDYGYVICYAIVVLMGREIKIEA